MVVEDPQTTTTHAGNGVIILLVGLVLTAAVPVCLYLFVNPTAGLIGLVLPLWWLVRSVPAVLRRRRHVAQWEPARLTAEEWPITPGRPLIVRVARPRRDGGPTQYGNVAATLTCYERTRKPAPPGEEDLLTERERESVVHRQACPVSIRPDGLEVELGVDPSLPPSMEIRPHAVYWKLEVDADGAGSAPLTFPVTVAAAVADPR